jgi:Ni,Fe-hydrogenase III large subunit
MTLLAPFAPVPAHRPWPRHIVDAATWQAVGARLGDGAADLLGLWGDTDAVHLVLRRGTEPGVAVVTLPCPDGRFPSIGELHAPAIRLERAVRDLWGLEPVGAPDLRPWLAAVDKPYQFLPAEGPGLHQIPVGPIHAGIIEPGHFRFTANGETVVRLEQRLGWVHKGIERRVAGSGLDEAARIIGRVSGDSTVAYALAFARAAEAALGVAAPPRVHALRAVMAELERVANHLGDIGAICNDAAFTLIHAHAALLREDVLQTAGELFGHRLMMDRVVPGGVAVDLDEAGGRRLLALAAEIRPRLAELAAVYDRTPSLRDRTVTTGIVGEALVRQWAAGGFVGRASGRDFDTRRDLPYPPYDRLRLEVPTRAAGDVDARLWVRIEEVEQSLRLIEQLVADLPGGPLTVALPPTGEVAEGLALVEGFRGDVLVWLRLDAEGAVTRCHPRDPSWFQWPLLEAAIEGNIVADFPLCNKSFNCSYAGHDL